MKKHEEGQGLVEYALIIVLIAYWVLIAGAGLEFPTCGPPPDPDSIPPALGPGVQCTFDKIAANVKAWGSSENLSASQADIMSSAEQSTLEVGYVLESIETFGEAAVPQAESYDEGLALLGEAVVEGIEVVIAWADDNSNQALSEALSQLVQDVRDGNPDAVPDAIALLATDLAEAPAEVSIAVLLKVAPRLIDSHAALSGGSVSPDTIAAAQQALEQLDPDLPGKAEAQERLAEVVDIVELLNIVRPELAEAECTVLGMIIAELQSAGEEGRAEQLAADSAACGY